MLFFLVLDQFLHSNINTRTDSYGGSPEARCKFPLQLLAAVAAEIGPANVGIRLEPTGLYNGTYGNERVETWLYLCEQLASTYGTASNERLSYVHFIEPRMDRVKSNMEIFWKSWTLAEVSNDSFREILKRADVPCITCGGWDASNAHDAVDVKGWDAVAFAKWFVSNPDLPERIKLGKPLQAYDRSRFYGAWDGVRETGYSDYLVWEGEGQRIKN